MAGIGAGATWAPAGLLFGFDSSGHPLKTASCAFRVRAPPDPTLDPNKIRQSHRASLVPCGYPKRYPSRLFRWKLGRLPSLISSVSAWKRWCCLSLN
jgi:hypothetical protein